MKKILVIGGGTGTSVVLSGLKKYDDLDLSIIVNMTDDGGSNAVVRDEFGILPLSDLRKSLIALADESSNDILRELFVYRFTDGSGIKGHTLGNLLMLAMVEITGSEEKAVELLQDLFRTKGNIIPVTTDDVRLVARYEDGSTLVGEHLIDEIEEDMRIVDFSLDSEAKITDSARRAIEAADCMVIGPGDTYTSILACIVVDGVKKAIQESKGKVIFVSNLMSKIGQTRGLTHGEIVKIVEKYIGRKIDRVVLNSGDISQELIQRYTDDGEALLEDDLVNDDRVLREDVVANSEVIVEKGDTLKRSLVRHDPDKLGRVLHSLFWENRFRETVSSILSRFS